MGSGGGALQLSVAGIEGGILIMDSGLVLTVADLRARTIVVWEQCVHLSFE